MEYVSEYRKKGKAVPVHVMEAERENGSSAPLTLNFGNRMW
jgi:hypothetical protein